MGCNKRVWICLAVIHYFDENSDNSLSFCSAKRSLKRIPMIKLELVQKSCKNILDLISQPICVFTDFGFILCRYCRK